MTLKNIDENAIIKIESKHTSNGETDSMELVTTGRFYQKGKKFYIFYNETEEMEMANCSVMMIADGDKVTMKRTGEYELKLNYIAGVTESVVYYMPYGKMDMTQTTKSVSCCLDDSGGSVDIDYELYISGERQRTQISIKIKRKQTT